MEQTIWAYGRAVIVAGMVPVMLVTALTIALLSAVGIAMPAVATGVQVSLQDLLLAILIGAGMVGTLLTALNKQIIHFYEGAFSFQRRWLLKWSLRRNLQRHEALYQPLLARRQMHEGAEVLAAGEDGSDPKDRMRRVSSAALAIDEAHAQLESAGYDLHLPIDRSIVAPTALGNAYAVMEEYPYERYGIDPMVFWPRLLAVLPSDYRASIGEQKTTCDFLLNSSLLLACFGLMAGGLMVAGLAGASVRSFPAAAAVILAALVSYGLYRAAVAETRVLGKLINGAFDLYRGRLLEQFRLAQPPSLHEEQALWRELATFIRRGETFYYPEAAVAAENDGESARAKRDGG